MDGQIDKWMYEQMNEWINGCMNGWKMDKWMNRQEDRLLD